MKTIRSRVTYANVMSTLAVFLVLGGGAVAAVKLGKNTVGTKQLKENAVTASKIKNGAITGSKLDLAALGAVPTATNATNAVNSTNAVNATNATTANTAKTATNALSLGGTPASGYTRSDCNSISGAIKGFASIEGAAVSEAEFSTAGVEFPYDCSGGQVLAKKVSAGIFKIKFVNSPVLIALVSSADELDTASVTRLGPGEFLAAVWNETLGMNVNGSFSILTP